MRRKRGGNLQAAGNFRIEVFRGLRESLLFRSTWLCCTANLKVVLLAVLTSPCLLMHSVPSRLNCLHRQLSLEACGFSGHIPPSPQQPDQQGSLRSPGTDFTPTATKHEVQTGLFPPLLLQGVLRVSAPWIWGSQDSCRQTICARADIDFPPFELHFSRFGNKSLHKC